MKQIKEISWCQSKIQEYYFSTVDMFQDSTCIILLYRIVQHCQLSLQTQTLLHRISPEYQ